MLGGMGERKEERKGKNNFSKIRPKTLIPTAIFPHKKCIFLGEGAQVMFEIRRGISPSKNIKKGGHCLSLCESKQNTKVSPVRNANMGCEEVVKHQV